MPQRRRVALTCSAQPQPGSRLQHQPDPTPGGRPEGQPIPADTVVSTERSHRIGFRDTINKMVVPTPSSLHGSPLLDAGLVTLNPALSTHPALVCLDLGDCMLGDEALGLICGMLPPDGAKSGNKHQKNDQNTSGSHFYSNTVHT